jgi:plasmid stabilization system protein ParE
LNARYVLAPQAARDLVNIWQYLTENASHATADRVESVSKEKFAFLAENPRAGHTRKNLTDETVRFFPAYSYLIVYRTGTSPLQVVSILHGRRDLEKILKAQTFLQVAVLPA